MNIIQIFINVISCKRIFLTAYFISILFYPVISKGQDGWCEQDSKHFRVIYQPEQEAIVPHLLHSAENSLNVLMKIFNYKPKEKIIINTYDISDFGFASTTTVPEDFIRLEVEPFEPGYENIPYDERFQWVLSHELVHVVVDDKASSSENLMRTIFAKVAPEQKRPMTILFSLLTNYSRYTPRWHQEGIAVFLETWLSGGFGRELGNFDEMYFRTLTADSANFPSFNSLDAESSKTSFLLGILNYLYGARFSAYLSIKYGANKLIEWYKEEPDDLYEGFINKFKDIYGLSLTDAWKNFIDYEKAFQEKNINRIKQSPVTKVKRLSGKSAGWVTSAYVEHSDTSLIFGFHHPNHLASVQKLKISSHKSKIIGTLPSPSLFDVASTAYDDKTGLFFYTTNNNELYRDLWVLETSSGDTKELFKNSRVGDLTVSDSTHELWAVMHSDAKTSLVYSAYPYHQLVPVIGFNIGDILFDLSVSPSGHYLSGILHRANGQQSIIVVNCDSLKNGGSFKYRTISDNGSPGNPSWSPDEKYLYWNAYINGVSNIYRINLSETDAEIEPMSNVLTGLFKPLYLNKDSLFAFEFTSKGFLPVIIPNKSVEYLHAIKYLGEKIVDKNPVVKNWMVKPLNNSAKLSSPKNYNSISSLKILTFIPEISGFQNQKVLGVYTHISDPLIYNDLELEFGVSPFKENHSGIMYHFKGKYSYKHEFEFGYEYNAPDFYDLFNNRKRGLIGTKLSLANIHYWVYDNPLKVKQRTEFDWYTGIKFLNDNLVKISSPDFLVGQTEINSKNLRRSIGSIDFEEGNEFNYSLVGFYSQDKKENYAGQIYFEWDNYSTWLLNHNIFHFKLASGYSYVNRDLIQGKFYFGGFGNRRVEDENVRQYRKVFRFPGIPIYSLQADKFVKLMIENELPALRFSNAAIGQHYLSNINISFYSQGLLVKSLQPEKWVDIGAQINLVFRHWYNLESTLSAGIAKAWSPAGNSWEWFISYKLLKN